MLKFAGAGAAGVLLAACQPQVVKETVEVEVEKVVTEIVEVERTVQVEVEKEVVKEVTTLPPEPAELRVALYSWKPMQDWVAQVKTQYELAHPNVTVTLEVSPYDAWVQKVTSQLAAGAAPAVFPGQWIEAVQAGQILELTEYVDADPEWSWDDFWPHNVQGVTIDPDKGLQTYGNRKWGMPQTGTMFLWAYNVKLFDAAGLDYPSPDWTFEEMRDAAQTLTLDGNGNNAASAAFDPENIVQFGVGGLEGWKILGPIAWSYGHPNHTQFLIDYINRKSQLDLPETKEAFQFVYDCLHTYHVHPTPQIMEGLTQPFESGQIAMYTAGSWMLPSWNDSEEIQVALMEQPIGPAGRFYHGTGANQWEGCPGTQDPGILADFMKYLGGPASMELVILTKCGPPSRVVEGEKFFNENLPNLAGAERLSGMFKNATHAMTGPGMAEVESYWGQETQLLWLGEATVDEVLDAMQKRIQEILDTPR